MRTPRPWHLNSGMVFADQGSALIAKCPTNDPEAKANAALIAAAPEMLEALQDACEVLQRATTDDSDTETAILHNRILELLRRLENDNA